MSKHAIDDDDKGDFWKKMRYGAAAAVTLGSGLYAVTSVLKKQGLSSFVDEVKTVMQTAPHLMADSTPKPTLQPDDEARAVLNMQLKFAMERQDMQRVQEISRELDKLEANVSTNHGGMPMMTQPPKMHVPSLQTMHSQQMQMHNQMAPLVPQTESQMPVSQMTSHMPPAQMTPQMSVRQMAPQMSVQQMAPAQMAPHTASQMAPHTASQMAPQMASFQPEPLQAAQPKTTPAQAAHPQMAPAQTTHPQMTPAQAAHTQMVQMPPLTQSPSCEKPGDATAQAKEARPPARKPMELTPRQAAMQMLQGGDIVEAMDPVTTQWSPAVIRTITKSGLVEVRWDDPGMDGNGKPFHPIGEVWAEQIRLKRRPAAVVALPPQKTAATVEEEPVTPSDGLQVGDTCYAMGQVVAKTWFAAKLIGVRARSPPMRVEYMATLDGQTTELLLPSPRKDFIHVDQLRRDKPEVESTEMSRREALEEKAEAKAAEQASQGDATTDVSREDDVVISPDLMCVVCERPDDEPNMLVCDCKKGYHIYCLSPPLEKVPEDDWKCPKCAKKNCS
jgi:hypothetical protein